MGPHDPCGRTIRARYRKYLRAAPRTRADGSQRRRPTNYAPVTGTVAVLAARTLLLTKLSNPM